MQLIDSPSGLLRIKNSRFDLVASAQRIVLCNLVSLQNHRSSFPRLFDVQHYRPTPTKTEPHKLLLTPIQQRHQLLQILNVDAIARLELQVPQRLVP